MANSMTLQRSLEEEWIIGEPDNLLGRDQGILAADTVNDYLSGTLLAFNTGTKQYHRYVPGDGTFLGTPVALCVHTRRKKTGTHRVAVLVRGPSRVNGKKLPWPAGISAPQKTAAAVSLLTVGIQVGY